MKAEWINPFIEGVVEFFGSMLATEAVRGNPRPAGSARDSDPLEVTAEIGISGTVRGMVTLGFPAKTAIAIVNRLLSTDTQVIDEMVIDGVAESVNIVAGSAKTKLARLEDMSLNLGLPSVVSGKDYAVQYPSGTVGLEVPFTSELGPFLLRVMFENDK